MRFTLKCLLILYPAQTVMYFFILFVNVVAYNVRIMELPVMKHLPDNYYTLDQYFNSFYMTIITITTVGYGDITPISYFGRMIMMCAALVGALLISLLVLTVSNTFELTPIQTKVFRKINASHTACITVQCAIRYYIAKKKVYIKLIKENPDIINNSRFLQIAKDKKTWTKYTDKDFFSFLETEMSRENA